MGKGGGVFYFIRGLKGVLFRRYTMVILTLCVLLLYGCEASVKVKWPKSDAFRDQTMISQESRT